MITSVSRQEEIIGALWIIASLLAFSIGHEIWGWVFAIKGALDTLCAIVIAVLELKSGNRD